MKPLEGIKVVDFTQVHAGSLTTMLLADFGAEVIKIERAGMGDLSRHLAPFKNGASGYMAHMCRGHKSISVNAGSEKGRELILRLLAEADVLVENFKYGSMERLKLTYEEVKKVNPGIIYASMSAFGQTGPMRATIGLDIHLQAMSGLMDRTGFPDGPPTRVGMAAGDHIGGTYLATAVMFALMHKKKTGEGQRVDVAILDSVTTMLEAYPMIYALTGKVPPRVGNSYPSISPYDAFKVKDGYVSMGIATDDQWQRFCKVLGLEHLAKEPKYMSNESRGDHYEEPGGLREQLEKYFENMTKHEIEAKLRGVGLACGAVNTVAEAMEMEQVKARNMLVTVVDKNIGDTVTMPGVPIRLSKTPGGYTEGAPLLGEHTRYYMKKLGYSDAEIQELCDAKVVEVA